MRFYPDHIPEFADEPTTDKFDLISIPDIGEGVKSLVQVNAGEVIFAFTGHLLSKVSQYTFQVSKYQHIHDPYIAGRLSHSCIPNAVFDMFERRLVAIKKICANDVINVDYDRTEDILVHPFICQCKMTGCRQEIRGRMGKEQLHQLQLQLS